jgi:hypothetical protein
VTGLLLVDTAVLSLQAAVKATAEAVDQATSGSGDGSVSGDYASSVSWGLIYGQLRGRIPYPVPFDLLAVGIAVALRWTSVMESSGTIAVQSGEVGETRYPTFQGFNISELAVLWRYRIRTA